MSESAETAARPVPETTWPHPAAAGFGLPAAIGCLLAAQVLSAVWAVSILSALAEGDTPLAYDELDFWMLPLVNLGLWIGYSLGPIVYRRAKEWPVFDRKELGCSPGEAGAAVAIGVATQLALLPALYWVVLKIMPGDPGSTARELVDRTDGWDDVGWLILMVLVAAPVIEEWFFRGFLLPAMSHTFGVAGGVIGSSIVFALVHGQAILLPGLFLFGVILALIVGRTGRLGPAIAAHFAFNATTLVQLLAF